MSLVVLFEDAHLLAVVKPAGILTQRNLKGEPALEEEVRAHLDPRSPGGVYLGTVHRLDRPVSGVILWAKTPKAAKRLAGQFARREVAKEYLAVCEDLRAEPGEVGSGTWTDWLTASSDASGRVYVVAADAVGARPAETRFAEEAGPAPNGLVRLRLSPVTGRTHQLRAQAAARGMPVLGDAAYGAVRPFHRGIALATRTLRFRHPTLRTPVELVAPVPERWPGQGAAAR